MLINLWTDVHGVYNYFERDNLIYWTLLAEPTCATAFGYFPVSDNSSSSKRTVQTQCNMFLWNYLNGKVEDSGKSEPILTPLPPQKKTIWTQCSFVENAVLKNTSNEKTGSFELKSVEATAITSERKTHIKNALDLLRSPLYKGLRYKVINII